MKRIIVASISLILLTGAATQRIVFETEPRVVAPGRSPKFLARRAHGLLMSYTAKSPAGPGADLLFQSSADLGDSFTEPVRINSNSGEVSDHGENSPILMASPDESMLYAVWNARDPKNPSGSHVRFSSASAMHPAWSPAITINDDSKPVSHGFQGAAVGPDGAIYIAWLDMRNSGGHGSDHGQSGMTGGLADIYLARSKDGGKTFGPNVRVAGNVCPCCRVTIGFAGHRVLLAWRQVEPGDVRDIFIAGSSDGGQTWGKPVAVARDGWKIKGCPHVGPAMATLGRKLYVAWFTEGGDKPGIYLAYSTDGGETFSTKQPLATGTEDPTHPQMAAGEGRVAVVFQARDGTKAGGWGKMAVYYREIDSSGTLSPLVRAAEGKGNASYPAAALGMSGRVFVGWTENSGKGFESYLLRGRVR